MSSFRAAALKFWSRSPWPLFLALAAILGLLTAFLLTRTFSGPSSVRNVLLITMDTTRADHLGCYGRRDAGTPSLDRLASEGALFDRCASCAPLTLPSHACIMTSKYPYAHGARNNASYRVADVNVTLAEVLRERGYATQATVASVVLNRLFGLDQGFEAYNDIGTGSLSSPARAERPADEMADDAISMLRSLSSKPFFLWVHFYDPHEPYEPRKGFPLNSIPAYHEEIEFMDSQIGRLLAELKRLDLEDNTLVVAVADHGEGLGDHGELTHGFLLYETTLRVPLLMRCPGIIPAGKRVDSLVRTIDIAPTILDLMGRPALKDGQGSSLKPLLLGKIGDLHVSAYAETFVTQFEFGLSPLRSLIQETSKYILAPKPELYDLVRDPGETRNLIEAEAPKASTLRADLKDLIRRAPPLPPDQATSATPSAELVEQLKAMGYTADTRQDTPSDEKEIDRFEPKGRNPMEHKRAIRLMFEARKFENAKDYVQMEQLVRQADQDLPDSPAILLLLCYTQRLQDRLNEALADCKRALALDPVGYNSNRMTAEVLVELSRFDEAIRLLKSLLEKYPGDTKTRYILGMALAGQERLAEAEAEFRSALASEPQNPKVLNAMAVILSRQNRQEEAIPYLRKALEIDPGYEKARTDLRLLLQALEQHTGP